MMADSRSTTVTPRTEPIGRSVSPDQFDPSDHPVCVDSTTPVEVTQYVRGDVSAPSKRQIESVARRLEALSETQLVAEVHTEQWPPRRHAVESESDATTCGALVDRLDRWADDVGCSLRPAIRRRAPKSLLDDEPSEPDLCVPVMLLTLTRATPDASGLAGVVPYTVPDESGGATTYTVADWLTAAERAVGVDTGESRGRKRGPVSSRRA